MDEILAALNKISEKLDIITGKKQKPKEDQQKPKVETKIEIEPLDVDENELEEQDEEVVDGDEKLEEDPMKKALDEELPKKEDGKVDIAMILGRKKKTPLI